MRAMVRIGTGHLSAVERMAEISTRAPGVWGLHPRWNIPDGTTVWTVSGLEGTCTSGVHSL